MKRRSVLALPSLGITGLAGCLGSENDDNGTSENSTTEDDAPPAENNTTSTENATPTENATSTENDAIPDELGEPAPDDTIDVHEQALKNAGSFTVEAEFIEREAFFHTDFDNPNRVTHVTVLIEYVYDTRLGSYEAVYHDDEQKIYGAYRTPDTGYGTSPLEGPHEDSTVGIPKEDAEKFRFYLTTWSHFDDRFEESQEAGVTQHNGESVTRYVARSRPDYEEFRSMFYVNDNGIVTYFEETHLRDDTESTGYNSHRSGTVEFTDIGTTTVSAPDWYEEWVGE